MVRKSTLLLVSSLVLFSIYELLLISKYKAKIKRLELNSRKESEHKPEGYTGKVSSFTQALGNEKKRILITGGSGFVGKCLLLVCLICSVPNNCLLFGRNFRQSLGRPTHARRAPAHCL